MAYLKKIQGEKSRARSESHVLVQNKGKSG